jgi:hypothetical protein
VTGGISRAARREAEKLAAVWPAGFSDLMQER